MTDQVANIATQPGVLLVESTDVSGLADDDVLHRVEQLGVCRVSGKVERVAQRVELEDVVMVSGTGESTGPK